MRSPQKTTGFVSSNFFKYARNGFSSGKESRVSLTYLRKHVLGEDGTLIPLPAIKSMLQVFEEFNLAKCKFLGDGFVVEIKMIPAGGKKIDLEKSVVLAKLKGN